MDSKNYYRILGIREDSSAEDIKIAYRKLAMQCHPDHNQGKEEWANQKFKEINEAFGVLGNPEKRRQYDDFGWVENIADTFDVQAARTTFQESEKDFGGAGLGFDFLDNIFGGDFGVRGFGFRTFRAGFSRPGKTRFEKQSGIDLEDLFKQENSPEVSVVNYEIVLSKEQAFKGMEKEIVRKGKRLTVNIPAGVKMDTRIKLRNALETTDGRPGDIIIIIKVK
jgi:DnaJ-class molecular chaperone